MLASVLSALPPGLHFFLNSDFVDIFAPAGLSFTHLSYVCHYWITLDTPRKAARLQGAPGPPFPPLPTNTRRRQPTASGSTNVAQPRDQPPHIPDVERSLPPSLPAERWRSRPPSITSESTSSLTESTHSLETSRPHMSRLDIPKLSSPLTPASVNRWLGICEDSFQVYNVMNASSTLAVELQIVLAGIKMEDPAAAAWWGDNRTELKALSKWEDFASRVRKRLVPAGWKIDGLRAFYAIRQGCQGFGYFVQELQDARNALASSGTTFAIKDYVFKNHLLFFAQEILTLRVMAIPSFVLDTISVDELVSLMSSTSDSMLAENAASAPAAPSYRPRPFITGTSSAPSLSSSTSLVTAQTASPMSYALPELTYAERQNLKAAGGCYHCRLTPASAGWIAHFARECPGDPAKGIPPRRSNPSTAGNFVAAVGMSSCVIGDGSDSDCSEDDYGGFGFGDA